MLRSSGRLYFVVVLVCCLNILASSTTTNRLSMTPQALEQFGKAKFGDKWRSDLAYTLTQAGLPRTRQSIDLFAKGKRTIPAELEFIIDQIKSGAMPALSRPRATPGRRKNTPSSNMPKNGKRKVMNAVRKTRTKAKV